MSLLLQESQENYLQISPDQVYKEKENKVEITVVCCNPEKIRDKLCCKGAKVIKSIEILDPPKPEKPKPKDPEKPKPKEPEKPKPKDPEKEPEKPKPKEPEKPKPDKKVTFKDPPKDPEKPNPAPKQEQPKPPAPAPAPTPPPAQPLPILGPEPCEYPPISPGRNCCGPCSQGYGGGPCYFGHGPPPPPMPQPCFDGYYVYGCHDRPCHVTRCDYYFSDENPQACSIM
ncbi:pollen-specific leucine-rich repeat extensin-like protein 2 isoform X2 [Salvia splendens]|uniref:pollen-specific leucine-rich repeat extensin-like protein 2 isoform X2 n=1 Tax=Salvia splendens TaxID=180675 RepID=UPI001C27A3D2|nr:pollen-specific leucine-rich repeat extensin-like protein 2 isoform X2 [Salvia splendens]